MRDIRMLTLYKQHYMDQYDRKLDSDYSCWGYYDGLDITEIELRSYSALFKKRSHAPISELWYKMGEKNSEITGQYSSLNIGLFRCMTDDEEQIVKDFWTTKERMLFFGVAFLQLDASASYRDFSKSIEGEVISSKRKKQCNSVAYCTFDNADLVLLIHSNSLTMMEEYLQEIEKRAEVRYLHSVLGVSEQYLADCKKQEDILYWWRGTKCYVHERVSSLDIRLVSSGEPEIIEIEKKILADVHGTYKIRNFHNALYGYTSGHENYIISIADTNVRCMLALLVPGGFATHQNKSYQGHGEPGSGKLWPRLFNIETSYILKSHHLSEMNGREIPGGLTGSVAPHNWFQGRIAEYRNRLKDAWDQKDESLYSYFLALLRTLNTLVQYERFSLSEDIFYLLYPSFKMFDEKLRKALDECGGTSEYVPRLENVKQSLCEYVEFVNSVIYHTVHTDQVFLMIPGYSGTSFSIPIKLNMLYLWFTDLVAKLLGTNARQYRCILVPTMESKPRTRCLEFESVQSNFLVCVKLSQRMLYMPRALMIALAHEMGHYIGGNMRCRKERADSLVSFTAQYLADAIFPHPDEIDLDQSGILDNLKTKFKEEAERTMNDFLKDAGNGGYYGDDVKISLHAASCKLLAECKTINNQNVIRACDAMKVRIQEYLFQIHQWLEEAEQCAVRILVRDQMPNVISRELNVYREAFSDLAAVKLLKCDREAFQEANRISEGLNIRGEETIRRENAMFRIAGKEIGWRDSESGQTSDADRFLDNYLKKCNENITKKLESPDPQLDEIRQVYNMFAAKDTDVSCHKVYDTIVSCIRKMKIETDKEIG